MSDHNKTPHTSLDKLRFDSDPSYDGQQNRLSQLKSLGHSLDYLSQEKKLKDPALLQGNIENYIGMAQIPIGIAGPVLVNGDQAQGEFLVPLATTEGALVASYNRGIKVCNLAGGISTISIDDGVQRSPYFKFDTANEAHSFLDWIRDHYPRFHNIVDETSRYAKLTHVKSNSEGNSVILTFQYKTGDASGQNMVTIVTDKICKYILSKCPLKPKEWYIESNYSGDKKATFLSFANVRGKKVIAETRLSKELVEKVLKTTPHKMAKQWQSAVLGGMQSGTIGVQAHIANALTALFIACGQDVATISESSVGVTRMEVEDNGDLYVSLTIPTLIVGAVGGGTGLPTQQECLAMMGCNGPGGAVKFAEICGAVALAGEISIGAAMSADHFTSAHARLGRKKTG